MQAWLDHIVIGASQLAGGTSWVETQLGAVTGGGGKHPLMSTHNRLMRLADGSYLEVIATDPEAPSPNRPRWFSLDEPETIRRLEPRPHALCWVAAVDNIEKAVKECGYDCGRILEVTRGDLHWRLTVPDDGSLPENGILPSLIEWPEGIHPVSALPPTKVGLMGIQLHHPDAQRINDILSRLGLADLARADEGDPAIAFTFTGGAAAGSSGRLIIN